MKFTTTKCKIMQKGSNTKNFCSKMRANQLEMPEGRKDLGVLVNCRMTRNVQCNVTLKTAKAILGGIP